MGAHRRDYIWTGADTGWQKKRTTSDADYSNTGDGFPYLLALFRFFPDFFLDLFHSDTADFNLSFIQRIFLRINANYQYTDITACRGATKSYCRQAGGYVDGLMWPGETTAVVGPSLVQTAKIASDIHKQIENNYPGLTSLYTVESDAKAAFVISTSYGSKVSIDNKRGVTVYRATAEETAQEEAPAEPKEELPQQKAARGIVQKSYYLRLGLTATVVVLAIKAPVFDAVPTVIAQFFPRIVITLQPLLQKIRKGA